MKVLLTGFEPFGGDAVNSSWEVVRSIPEISGIELEKLLLPVSFNRAREIVKTVLQERVPDVVLSVGQAGNRGCVCLERVAINVADSRNGDVDGYCPVDCLIEAQGPVAYFSTLPLRRMVIKMKRLKTVAGFVHLPYLPCQIAKKPGTVAVDLSLQVSVMSAFIECLVRK